MKTVARAMLLAIALTGVATFETLIVGSALPGQAHATTNVCYLAARHYRNHFDYEPPPWYWGSAWFSATDGHWDYPLPGNQDQGTRPPPPAPPGDVSPPPPGEDDEPPPAGL
jgi:hypothetical protein